ncbi:MFS transporter [Bisgaard Taxon 10/6]|uniref:MFS transporter n=1 Tax=Exercitatus varius TaxID=67857 RepID=A0ABT6ETA9_9PAST|nr:MFS transporter [Exercitatus varius]MDG2938852.1 MFS transporter [Exercitatus varius]MDG2945949.1 MFS transporter [Exercitatus varius]
MQVHHKPANLVAFAFLLIAFLTGTASAFQMPTLSLFLSREIQVSPLMVGIFYAVNAIMGILISQMVARYSDKQDDRRKIIIGCCLIAIFGSLIFAFNRNYYVLAFLGTFFLGLGSSSNPQSFAFAREYAEHSQREAVMFTTIMRTQISLAWIIGPPVSFAIALNWGFHYMYLVAGLAFLLCALLTATMLPKISRKQILKTESAPISAPTNNRQSVIYLFTACFLMWMCNSMYMISMPLYSIHELHLPESLAGTLMGTAAGLEIPVMLIGSYLTKFFRKKVLILTALLSGFAFNLLLLFLHEAWQLVALQVLNAVFIGIIATLGMVYFQDLMPRQMGAATTLFGNAAKGSWILGGPLAGLIAEHWGYSSVFYLSVVIVLISFYCMWKVKSV